MFIPAVFVQIVLAATAIAVPAGIAKLVKRDGASTTPALIPVPIAGGVSSRIGAADNAPGPFNNINAGAWISGSPGDFDFVTGEFDVPLTQATSQGGLSLAIPYIGLDVFNCPNLLIAAVQISVIDTTIDYIPFWQWGSSVGTFNNIQLTANDEVRITVRATSLTEGIVTFSKNTNEQFQEIRLSFPENPLCLSTPGWLLQARSAFPLANFGDVAFDGAVATNGTVQAGPLDPRASTTNILRNGTVFTETGPGSQSITIRYTQ